MPRSAPPPRTDRDPAIWQNDAAPQRDPVETKLLLGLDLGTNCGYALSWLKAGQLIQPGEIPIACGQWDLSAGSYDSGAIRFVRLRQFLSVVQPDLIGYEDVKYTPVDMGLSSPTAVLARAAKPMEFLGALKATVATWAEERNIPCVGFPIADMKRRATNKGNANKGMMIQAANQMFYTQLSEDEDGHDNVADALFVLLLTAERYAKGIEDVPSKGKQPVG